MPIGKFDFRFERAKKAAIATAKLRADPLTALSAEKARDRQFAAISLVASYRSGRPIFGAESHVNAPVPVDQSKLILAALAEMKWTDPPLDPDGDMNLRNAFSQLRLTEKDGWQPPQPKANEDPNEVMSKAVSQWFQDHSAKYRIQRLVVRGSDAK